jgi:hypothetical protein
MKNEIKKIDAETLAHQLNTSINYLEKQEDIMDLFLRESVECCGDFCPIEEAQMAALSEEIEVLEAQIELIKAAAKEKGVKWDFSKKEYYV